MKIFVTVLFTSCMLSLMAQKAEVETSDKASMVILDSILEGYESAIGHKITFAVAYEVPGAPTENMDGILIQKGEQYNLDVAEQQFICDGETVWVYLKTQNEIQINDYEPNEESGEIVSPADIFSLHRSGQFIFAIANSHIENGVEVTEIVGKPTDHDSDYAKVRLSISDKDQKVMSLKIFNKDASRITMSIQDHDHNYKINPDMFNLEDGDYPGASIEDLRF